MFTLQIGQRKFLLLKRLKILYHGHTCKKTVMVKKLERFMNKNCKKHVAIEKET